MAASRAIGGGGLQSNQCTKAHQIGALFLIATTVYFTRLFDRSSSLIYQRLPSNPADVPLFSGSSLSWPNRGYGYEISLKIYVYKETEIDGLAELMRGRERKIDLASCVKGQWGTQVKIHKLLLQSKFRTMRKEEADFFFVPIYIKCVRMNGGLTDKEIDQTFIKVLGQMPYFRLSGGRNHIFVFPSGAGAHLFHSWASYLNRSIILTPEGDRTDKRNTSAFNTWKDIIIPGNINDAMTTDSSSTVKPIPLSKRKYLANFLGRAQGKVGRLQLTELAKQYPDKVYVLPFDGSFY